MPVIFFVFWIMDRLNPLIELDVLLVAFINQRKRVLVLQNLISNVVFLRALLDRIGAVKLAMEDDLVEDH